MPVCLHMKILSMRRGRFDPRAPRGVIHTVRTNACMGSVPFEGVAHHIHLLNIACAGRTLVIGHKQPSVVACSVGPLNICEYGIRHLRVLCFLILIGFYMDFEYLAKKIFISYNVHP